MKNMLFPHNGKTKSLKENVILVLSRKWPLTAKRIYNEIKKETSVSYQAVHKALKELAGENIIKEQGRQYQLNEAWIEQKRTFFENLFKYYKVKDMSGIAVARITTYKTSDEFYKNLTRMCQEEKILYLSSKTPALILTSEETMTKLRKVYVKALKKRFSNSDFETKYLFSGELTRKMIIRQKDRQALEKIKKLSQVTRLKLRYAPLHSVIAQAIGEKEWLLGIASPAHTDFVGCIHFVFENTGEIRQIYDSVFANALQVEEFINEIENKYKSTGL